MEKEGSSCVMVRLLGEFMNSISCSLFTALNGEHRMVHSIISLFGGAFRIDTERFQKNLSSVTLPSFSSVRDTFCSRIKPRKSVNR